MKAWRNIKDIIALLYDLINVRVLSTWQDCYQREKWAPVDFVCCISYKSTLNSDNLASRVKKMRKYSYLKEPTRQHALNVWDNTTSVGEYILISTLYLIHLGEWGAENIPLSWQPKQIIFLS